jgi:hypothetical protein
MPYLIALLIALNSLPAQAGNLGRLFFTPQERAALDRARHQTGTPSERAGEEPLPVDSITLNGHIRRSGGKSTVWLNGKPVQVNGAPQNVGISDKAAGEIAITPPESGRTYPLKVGQTLTPGSGEIRDLTQPVPGAHTGK